MYEQTYLFDKIYLSYYSALLHVVRQRIKDSSVAEDVLQDAYIKIWLALPSFDPKKGKIYTWMAAICINTALDKIKSRHYKMKYFMDPLSDELDKVNMLHYKVAKEDYIDVFAIVKKLEKRYNEPLLLYSVGYTHSEIANFLHIPLGTAKSRLRIGLSRLRRVW